MTHLILPKRYRLDRVRLGSGPAKKRAMVTRNVLIGRGQFATNVVTIASNLTTQRVHWAYSDGGIANIKTLDTKGYIDATGYLTASGRTFKRYIEYPYGSGAFFQVTWSAGTATTQNTASGGTYESDVIAGLSFPPGWVQFGERTCVTAGGAAIPVIELPTGGGAGLGTLDGNNSADLSHSGTIAPSASVNYSGATAFKADVTGYNPRGFFIWGDSIAFGQGDEQSAGPRYASGYVARALEALGIGYCKLAKEGQRAADIISATPSLAAFITHLPASTEMWVEYGVNDLRLGRTKAQLEADLQTMYGLMAGLGSIHQSTITPRADTTDGYVTVANQTPKTDGTMTSLNALNADIRANAGAIKAAPIDVADAVMSARDSDVFNVVGGVAPTPDGTHLVSVYAASVAANIAGQV